MDSLELFSLRRSQSLLARRLDIVEAILERAGIIDQILGGGHIGDPPPEDIGRVISGFLGGRLGPQVDPAPDDLGRIFGGLGGWRPPRPGDPAPLDMTRFTKSQLEFALHSIEADRTRLDAAEQLIKEQIKAGGAAERG